MLLIAAVSRSTRSRSRSWRAMTAELCSWCEAPRSVAAGASPLLTPGLVAARSGPIGGRRRAYVELARRRRAVRVRVEVEGERQVRGAAGGRAVHPQPGDEVVDAASDRVHRYARHGRPVGPVCRCAQDQVVGGAARLEAAIGPGYVDLARAVYLSRGQAEPVAQAPRWTVGDDVSDARRFAPAGAAVG